MKLSLHLLHASRGQKFHSCKYILDCIAFAMQLNGFVPLSKYFYVCDYIQKSGISDSFLFAFALNPHC